MSDDKPFAEAIRNGCGKLRVGSMVVAAEYGDMAEATARRIDSDHLADCTARERKAAAKALRLFADSEALKDDFGHGEVITKHDVRTALRAEADSVEKGER